MGRQFSRSPHRHSRPSTAFQALRINFSRRLKAGIHNLQTFGICGNGDAHLLGSEFMDSRLRGNDGEGRAALHTLRNKC